MALKGMWSGVLVVNTLFKVHVAVCKGSEPYRGKDQLTELCDCCHEPFKRTTVCEKGRTRLTEEMTKAGETENTTEAVKGVKDGEKYVVLKEAALESIAAAGTSDGMTVAAVIDVNDVPAERTSGLYYLRPDDKVKRSKEGVETLFGALESERRAIIAKWAPRGREMLVAIYAKDGALVMTAVMFDSEVRPPDEKCLIGTDAVPEQAIAAAGQVLATLPGASHTGHRRQPPHAQLRPDGRRKAHGFDREPEGRRGRSVRKVHEHWVRRTCQRSRSRRTDRSRQAACVARPFPALTPAVA